MSIGRYKTIEFIDEIEKLITTRDESNLVADIAVEYNERDYLKYLVSEARNLLNYGEWMIALEYTLDNLYEVNFKLDSDILKLAESALLTIMTKEEIVQKFNLNEIEK